MLPDVKGSPAHTSHFALKMYDVKGAPLASLHMHPSRVYPNLCKAIHVVVCLYLASTMPLLASMNQISQCPLFRLYYASIALYEPTAKTIVVPSSRKHIHKFRVWGVLHRWRHRIGTTEGTHLLKRLVQIEQGIVEGTI